MGSTTVPAATSGAAASDKWVLISSVTPTNAASTVTFSSISGYKKLLLKTVTPSTSTTAVHTVTFNSDTAANYSYSGLGIAGGSALISAVNSTSANGIQIGFYAATGTVNSELEIAETDTTGIKNISGIDIYTNTGNSSSYPIFNGRYYASAAITSVTTTLTGATYQAGGTVALYGVAV